MARYDRIAVYILANERNGTLYTGVTSELVAKVEVGADRKDQSDLA